jgi:hypothetical protein
MKVLKILFYVTMILFFLIVSVVIYNNTNFWKSRIYLSCEISEISEDFSLVIDKKHKAVLWRGKEANQDSMQRKLDSFTEVSINMSWNSNGSKITFVLDRLTGKFRMSREKNSKEDSKVTGRCSEKQKSF